jgi:hypothetical protein
VVARTDVARRWRTQKEEGGLGDGRDGVTEGGKERGVRHGWIVQECLEPAMDLEMGPFEELISRECRTVQAGSSVGWNPAVPVRVVELFEGILPRNTPVNLCSRASIAL